MSYCDKRGCGRNHLGISYRLYIDWNPYTGTLHYFCSRKCLDDFKAAAIASAFIYLQYPKFEDWSRA